MIRYGLLFLALMTVSPALARDARLFVPVSEVSRTQEPITWNLQTPSHVDSNDTSPVLAGMLSAVLPGLGQLKLGKQRGWIYMGLDVASWFGYFALDAAGDQGIQDYQRFADKKWDWNRYTTTASCGEGLGPIDFDQENASLLDVFENDSELFFAEIGDQEEYACGWETQRARSQYNSQRNHASDLSNRATSLIYVVMLNRLVSAIDAARTAASMSSDQASLDLQWRLDAFGEPQVRLSLNRKLR